MKQFLSFDLPRRVEWGDDVYFSSIKGFPPALWDDDRRGFHFAGCTDFIGIVIIELKSLKTTLIGELQVVCNYSKEVDGCWVYVVSKTKFENQTIMEQICVELLSWLRESNDYAHANAWHGYQTLRDLISEINKYNPTTLDMEVDRSIAWTGTQNTLKKARGKIPFGASFKFTKDPRVQESNGSISMVLSDSFEQKV